MNKKTSVKWYKGFGNLFTIISFMTLIWPFSVVVMWLFSDWSKRTKKIITTVVYLPLTAYLLGGFISGLNRIDQFKLLTPMNTVNMYTPILILIMLIILLLTHVFYGGVIKKYLNHLFILFVFLVSLWTFSLGFLISLVYLP